MIIKLLVLCVAAFVLPLLVMVGVTVGILVAQEIEKWWKYGRK